MTININYQLSLGFQPENLDFARMDESDLRYGFFTGSVRFCGRDVTLRFDWGWIPLIDFAICLSDIGRNLSQTETGIEEFTFTESDDTISFKRFNDLLQIEASTSDQIVYTTSSEFQNAVVNFCNRVFLDAISRYPDLRKDKWFGKNYETVVNP